MLVQCVPYRGIFNLLQPALTQCDVGPVCVLIELLSTYFNLPQPSVMLAQVCVPIELVYQYFNLPDNVEKWSPYNYYYDIHRKAIH